MWLTTCRGFLNPSIPRRVDSRCYPHLTGAYNPGVVHLQGVYRCPASWGDIDHIQTALLPGEVFLPPLRAWIEEGNHLADLRIDGFDLGGLVPITLRASQPQVPFFGGSTQKQRVATCQSRSSDSAENAANSRSTSVGNGGSVGVSFSKRSRTTSERVRLLVFAACTNWRTSSSGRSMVTLWTVIEFSTE